MIANITLTPTQRRLFELFLDGGEYTFRQIADHLGDGVEESGIPFHISNLRAAISPYGLVVVLHNRGKHRPSRYQLLRRYAPGE